jgi:hypothetical protein
MAVLDKPKAGDIAPVFCGILMISKIGWTRGPSEAKKPSGAINEDGLP